MDFAGKYTYLLLNVFTILGPMIRSFEPRIQFYKKWRAFLPANLITAAVFILWDIAFTENGIWGFNPNYLIGVDILGLPLEEWLFFITIPYACIFLHEVSKAFFVKYAGKHFSLILTVLLLIGLAFVFLQNPDGWYTATALTLAAVLLISHQFFIKPEWYQAFMVSFPLAMIGFVLVNGVLTSLPVVWYNDLENSGIRLISIPADDIFYGTALLLMNTSLYEMFLARSRSRAEQRTLSATR